jgi:SAM-dependent methyltransferase
MSETGLKAQVRQFYDQVGWQSEGDGFYQNARYEDLRPVSREYIHRCHLRVKAQLNSQGKYLLDAGSGPIQYPEYLTYSQGYPYRVCLDISWVALIEARKRIGDHGLFVVADVANLPFRCDAFDSIVSLHTLHHLSAAEQKKAYVDLHRTLCPGGRMVIVNGWTDSPFMRRFQPWVNFMERAAGWLARRRIRLEGPTEDPPPATPTPRPTGTYVQKLNATALKKELSEFKPEIRVWRSVSVRFLRAVIHDRLGGRWWLRLLFWLEERFPRYFGENGQYPLIVIKK